MPNTFIEDEKIYWVDITTGEVWERSGGCSQCGDCCEDTENIFSKCDGNYDYNNPLTQVVENKCAYFRWLEPGKAGCVGRDTTYYNNGCNKAPTKPNHLRDWPNCTYKFTKVDPTSVT